MTSFCWLPFYNDFTLFYSSSSFINMYTEKDSNLISDTKHSFFDNIIMDIFLFVATVLSMIATITIIHLVWRYTKLKALLMGIALQLVKQTEAI